MPSVPAPSPSYATSLISEDVRRLVQEDLKDALPTALILAFANVKVPPRSPSWHTHSTADDSIFAHVFPFVY
ncbi:unnamed protein product [Linum trigynum]|uniref:Uncharacterized protein n=1 Tax=Linum trigynum TaxID=586398 RepID=A0AAV2D841_9ROSI